MIVSFIIVAYNAEDFLNTTLDALKKQDYDKKKVEVILVDSVSKDLTKKIMLDFKKKNNKIYKRVCILDNPKKILPCGWNVALKEASGDVILRVDAHSTFDKNFVKENVKEIKNGENIVGGHRISITSSTSRWQKLLLIAEQSLFGSGIAKYRRTEKKEYVNTLAHAMYRKKVFDEVGLYNENLARTEDNEMHYRMKKAGYKFLLSPNIVSYHHARNSFKGMVKQKYGNGKWIGITMYYCPRCFSLYHFIPFVFVIGLVFSLILLFFKFPWFILLITVLYALFNIFNIITISIKNKFHIEYLLLPFIFLALHISYGVGTIKGLLYGPIYKRRKK